jgi:hypothetical protein
MVQEEISMETKTYTLATIFLVRGQKAFSR